MQKNIVLENGTIPVYETSTGEKIVYGSELYKDHFHPVHMKKMKL
ncbi:hypothetical protein [Mediterraneibacter glycyrrhizinilyticus]|nr:hypothetical protein [Mediterraneibacter glycyrrhizinilyticus]MDN0043779.1 hypothetical protein [Mediterraneibacter glycyrrhizinilyticus]